MISSINILFTGGIPAIKRNQNKWFKVALQFGIRKWHTLFLKDHFKENATKKYGYKKRAQRYLQRKQRKRGHTKPILFFGKTKQLASTFIKTSGSANRAKGVMQVPWYVRDKPVRENLPALADEMTRVTPREMDKLKRFVGKEFARQINDNKEQVRIRIR